MKRLFFTSIAFLVILVSTSFAADRLIVNNDQGAQKFTVTDQGWVGINTTTPQAEIDLGGGSITMNGEDNSGERTPQLMWYETGRVDFGFGGRGGGQFEAYSAEHASRQGEFRFVYGGGDFGKIIFYHYNGSTWSPKMTLDKDGNLYVGHARCDGEVWYDSSSRDFKENITDLSTIDALQTLKKLKPVSYNYKTNKEETKLGFIAEDVPEIVATNDRKGTNTMDFVAILTKVVQEQQKQLTDLQEQLSLLNRRLDTK